MVLHQVQWYTEKIKDQKDGYKQVFNLTGFHAHVIVLHWIISTSKQTYFDFYDVGLSDMKPFLAWTYMEKKHPRTRWEDKNIVSRPLR